MEAENIGFRRIEMIRKIAGILLLAIIGWGGWKLYRFFFVPPLPLQTEAIVEIEIPAGSSISHVVEHLYRHRLIEDPLIASVGIRLISFLSNKPVYAGLYRFKKGETQYTVLRQLFRIPRAITRNITIPEGLTIWEIAGLLQHRLGLDSTKLYRLMTSDSLCRSWGIPASTVEGYLYPETYNVYVDVTEEQILDQLLRQHFLIWRRHFDSLARERGMSHHQVVTLASIIEAETKDSTERRRISGVFVNRLKLKMPLQADPTVQYALRQRRRLTYADLQIDHPYNTYRYAGLPPGPINSPGFAALAAALDPESHSFLYFVVAPDGSGRHVFSTTYAEHRKAVRQYRQYRRQIP